MINLGDYIGRLLSEVTYARVQADIEAVRVAEVYSSHPLLRNFPVPRIRFSNVEMNVPVVISEVEDEEQDIFSVDKVDSRTLTTVTEKVVTSELKKYKVQMNTRDAGLLRRALKAKSDDMAYIRENAISMETISKDISKETIKVIGEFKSVKDKIDKEKIIKLSKIIEAKIREELISKRKPPLRVKISPLTSHVREIGKTEHLVTLKLSLSEDAVEWTTIEENGKEKDILIPE